MGHSFEQVLMKNSNTTVPEHERAEGDAQVTAYPRLLRIFAGSTLAAALCGLAALATGADKGLHPAPFLALATLLAIAASGTFLSMLMCLSGETVIRWWRR